MADTVFELLSAGQDTAPAIVVPDGPTLTFAQMRLQVEHLTGQLNAVGVARGERVALVTPNGPEAALTFLAATACATAAPLNPAYREDEFRFYMDDLNAKVLITLPGDAEAAHAAAAPDVIRLALSGDHALAGGRGERPDSRHLELGRFGVGEERDPERAPDRQDLEDPERPCEDPNRDRRDREGDERPAHPADDEGEAARRHGGPITQSS